MNGAASMAPRGDLVNSGRKTVELAAWLEQRLMLPSVAPVQFLVAEA